MIKYIGSKRLLAPLIVDVVQCFPATRTVTDLFSGTSRVGHSLKRAGYRVLANDHNEYAHVLARCYVEADLEDLEQDARTLIRELNSLAPKPGYFTDTFCVRSRFFQTKNGARVDAIRDRIDELALSPQLEAVLLVSLMEAADRVDSTTGLQMAYLKDWAPRAHNDLELRMPAVLPRAARGRGRAYCLDALKAARKLRADIAYLDPPYNQHKYVGNYHIWETLVRWDAPDVYGVACKRVDCKTRRSDFNSKPKCGPALRQLLEEVQARVVIVSFNNEGYVSRSELEEVLRPLGTVVVLENDFKRYVGAQIGIHNPEGRRVGEVSHLRNTEYLYVAGDLDGFARQGRFSRAWSEIAPRAYGPG